MPTIPMGPKVGILDSLPGDILSQVLLRADLSSVSRCAAAAPVLRDAAWTDTGFWKAYAGPSMVLPSELQLSACSVRQAYRRWRHGLHGKWGSDFLLASNGRHCDEIFTQADLMIRGLEPQGEDYKELLSFSATVAAELASFDASCSMSYSHALLCVKRAEARAALLPKGSAQAMRQAFDARVRHLKSLHPRHTVPAEDKGVSACPVPLAAPHHANASVAQTMRMAPINRNDAHNGTSEPRNLVRSCQRITPKTQARKRAGESPVTYTTVDRVHTPHAFLLISLAIIAWLVCLAVSIARAPNTPTLVQLFFSVDKPAVPQSEVESQFSTPLVWLSSMLMLPSVSAP